MNDVKIAVDVDGVLLDTMKLFCELYNQRNGTSYSVSDVKQWEFFRDWGIPENDVYALLYEIFQKTRGVPLIDENAPQVMENLNKVYDVHILSARNDAFKDVLVGILKENGIENGRHYDEMHLVNEKPYDAKLVHAHDVFIDDNPNLVEPIKKMEHKYLLLFDQPWNQGSECNKNVHRVKNWTEIAKIIDAL